MRRKWIVGGAIAVGIILVMMAFISLGGSILKKEEQFKVLISTDKNVIHRMESFNLSLMDPPKDSNVTWILGDGNMTYGTTCSHRYVLSNLYEVFAIVKKDGERYVGNTTIFASIDDIHSEKSGQGDTNVRLRTMGVTIDELIVFYYSGAGDPEIKVNGKITGVTGRIQVYLIFFKHHQNGASGTGNAVYSQAVFRQDAEISETFEDLNLEPSVYPYSIELEIDLFEGTFDSWDFTSDAIYPKR